MTEAPYQDQFEATKASLPGPFARLRETAFAQFLRDGFPSQQREAWRYTRLSTLAKAALTPAVMANTDKTTLAPHLIDGAINLVFVNGQFDPAQSTNALPEGLSITPLAEAAEDLSALLKQAIKDTPDDALVALNTALMADGAVIRVAEGAVIDQTVHLLFYTNQPGASHIRNAVLVGADATATLVESYVGGTDETYWLNGVNQIILSGGCTIHHTKLQHEGTAAWHITSTKLRLSENDQFNSVLVHKGGATARHEVQVTVTGEGSDCRLAGVSIGAGKQVLDSITQLDHAVPNSTSDQLFKAVLDEGAHAIYQGKVIVRQDAQHTDARQANHNLLLARTAEASSKPELEIFADDVQCAHGATVGEVDKNMLFYLRARGLDEATAQRLLIDGFIVEVLERIDNETVRTHIKKALG